MRINPFDNAAVGAALDRMIDNQTDEYMAKRRRAREEAERDEDRAMEMEIESIRDNRDE